MPRTPHPYRVICISLYEENIVDIDDKVSELKRRGVTNASRSWLFRRMLADFDVDTVAEPRPKVRWSGAGSGRRRWSPELDELFAKVFRRYPEAEHHDPCPCGLTLAVIPRAHVKPEIHYPIPDDALRAEVIAFMKRARRAENRYEGIDGVLIVCEVA